MRQDIEASVIGGLLIGGLTPTASDVLATLEPEAFSIPLYRKAFEVIRKHARNRNLIDALMVAEACGEEHFTSILMTRQKLPECRKPGRDMPEWSRITITAVWCWKSWMKCVNQFRAEPSTHRVRRWMSL